MNTKMILTIKNRAQAGWIMWLLIILPFLLGVLNELLGLPWAIRYLLDIAWLWLFVLLVLKRKAASGKGMNITVLWAFLFLIFTALVYVAQYQSPLYYLWGVRNNFRFFVAFFAFASFLTAKDVEDYFKLFDALFWINFAVSLVQYYFLNLDGDHLGGLFSTEAGGNGYTNIFFLIVLTKDILFYLEKKEKLSACICKCVAALLVAALAELKFFFVELAVVIVLASLFTKFTWRKFWVLFGGLAAVAGFAALLVVVFPNFTGFLSIEWFLETALSNKGYTSSGDLNRLNAIPQINELWLRNGWEQLFGLGLGNCDTATYAFLNTPFFVRNGDMHYTWLSYAFMYLETGYIGLVFYYGFFALVYMGIRRIERRSEGITQTYCRMSRILVICCVLISVYNSSLRTEAGYMMFFALAVPFALDRSSREKLNMRNVYG